MNKQEIEDKLRRCGNELDQCLAALQSYNLDPDHLLLESIKEAIAHIAVSTLYFEKTRQELQAPWKQKCSFCNRTEDEVPHLIQGPGVLICDECVEQCHQIVQSKRNAAFDGDGSDA
jgi:hypothetical protein